MNHLADIKETFEAVIVCQQLVVARWPRFNQQGYNHGGINNNWSANKPHDCVIGCRS